MISTILRSSILSLVFVTLGSISLAMSLWSDKWSSTQLTATFFILAATHFVFRVLIYYALVNQLQSGKVRYTLSKILTLTHLFVASLFIMRVWLPDSGALLAAYGFIAAAIAFSIQDVFKNAFGGVLILIRNLYSVGDRVQIGREHGDVLDIGILYTRVLEILNWVDGDQPTGRIISIPNGMVISEPTHNYTADHSFIWDEIHLPITHASDWEKAESILTEVITEHTSHVSVQAMAEIEQLKTKYFLTDRSTDPTVYLKITDNWISLYLRYIVTAHDRRQVSSDINRAILTRLATEKTITIASTTVSVTTRVDKTK